MTNRNHTHGDDGHPASEVATAERAVDELLTIAEVADIVRAPVATLRYWRHLGIGPRSFRVGRGVRYWRTDVLTWLARQEQTDNARADTSSSRR